MYYLFTIIDLNTNIKWFRYSDYPYYIKPYLKIVNISLTINPPWVNKVDEDGSIWIKII